MSPTIAARPSLPLSFDKIPQIYSIAEYPPMSRSTASPSTTNTPISAYQMYPGLQTATKHRKQSTDPVPFTLNRPRKLSGSPNSVQSTNRPHEHPSLRTRSPAWKSAASYEPVESAAWRPAYLQPQRPAPIKGSRIRVELGEPIASLPNEVLEVVLEMLKQLHLDRRSNSCATCWMRDLCSVSLCSRKWYSVARLAL